MISMLSRITVAGPTFLPFAFADFLHEDLRRAEAEQEAIAGDILHDARFHRDLHRMARVGRDDAPADLNASGLARR